jgi:hypothetical protein
LISNFLITVGQTPPEGCAKETNRSSRRRGMWGRWPWTTAYTRPSTAARESSLLLLVVAFMCSYVQPLGPAADPRGMAFRALARVALLIATISTYDMGTGEGVQGVGGL